MAEIVVKCGSGRACVPASAPRKGASIFRWRLSGIETSRLYMKVHHSWVGLQRLRMATPHFRMETPLRGRSGGHTGTAPTVSFGWIARGWLISFGGLRAGLVALGGLHVNGYFVYVGLRGKI